MSPAKMVNIGSVVVILAVALIPAIPMGALILALVGLGAGYFVASDNRTATLVSAIFLAGGAGALDSIPAIGMYLTSILESTGSLLAAASVTVVVVAIYEKVTG